MYVNMFIGKCIQGIELEDAVSQFGSCSIFGETQVRNHRFSSNNYAIIAKTFRRSFQNITR